jgi:hypothetical protein
MGFATPNGAVFKRPRHSVYPGRTTNPIITFLFDTAPELIGAVSESEGSRAPKLPPNLHFRVRNLMDFVSVMEK